ncbi:thioredoxin [Archaeoglobales archaeon]|nr:MAG: thioredoxin [Archaeoglobales archaeon]
MKIVGKDEFDDVINREKLVVVDFYADWCMPCRFVAPILEKLEKEFDGSVEFAKVNVDENVELARRYNISAIPTLIMFYKGKILNSFIGALPESILREEIKKALETL